MTRYKQINDEVVPFSAEEEAAWDAKETAWEWATYRQALRDVPSQAGFPNTITWPSEPE
jgi:hypothetical protein